MTETTRSSALGPLEKFAASARADFRFAPLNALLLVGLFVIGLAIHLAVHPFSQEAVGFALSSALVMVVALRIAQVWETVIVLGTVACAAVFLLLRPLSEILLVTVLVALLISTSLQIAFQWERLFSCASAASAD